MDRLRRKPSVRHGRHGGFHERLCLEQHRAIHSRREARAQRNSAAGPSVIQQAPYELTAAGFGDVLAKPVSMTDWKLNQLLFAEYYCPFCAHLIRELEPAY